MSAKIWFITGCSRGFGREWALAALERGDSVVATARDTASPEALVTAHGEAVLPIRLDVTDRAAVFSAVASAHAHFGRLGEAPLAIATADYESRLATWNQWQPLSVAAHGGRG